MTKKKEFFPNLGGYPEWKPNKFVQDVKLAYENNGFCDAFVESSGRKGVGKTSFCLISGYQVYGSWKKALNHLYFTPKEALTVLLDRIDEAEKTGKPVRRLPYIIIDDATMSLNKSRWWLPSVQDFAEFYGIIRTCCAGVIFSGPSLRLPESIACDIQYKIIIKHLASAKKIQAVAEGNYSKSSFWKNNVEQAKKYGIKKVHLWRKAKIYTNFTIPSSTKRFISPVIHSALFPLHYPNDIYKEYDAERTVVVGRMGKKALMGETKKVIGRPMDKTLLHKLVRDKYNDLKKEGKGKVESAHIIGISEDMLGRHVYEANKQDSTRVSR